MHRDINAISTSDTRNNRSNSPYSERGQSFVLYHLSGTQNTNIQPSEVVTNGTNSFVPRPPVQVPQPSPDPTANRFRTTIQTNQSPQQRHASPSNNIRANHNLNNIPIRQRFAKTTDRSRPFPKPVIILCRLDVLYFARLLGTYKWKKRTKYKKVQRTEICYRCWCVFRFILIFNSTRYEPNYTSNSRIGHYLPKCL